MSRIVHFEIPAEDTGKITGFFTSVFGWQFQQWGEEEYFLTTGGDPEEEGIGGAVIKKNGPTHPVTNSISVDSIDDIIPVIESNGGKIVVPKQTVGDMGFLAYFTDPEGTIFGLWESAKQ